MRRNDGMKRGCIYFFYDGQGIVDDYIPYLLDDLMENIDELVVVCNGKLTDEGKKRFEKYTPHVIVRANEELDVGAYKEGLRFLGWDKVESFDELIMMNHTIMGPIYPFYETFDKMKEKDVDFWGLTKHFYVEKDPYGTNPYKCIPEHIQSHFLVFRKKLMQSKEFHDYWEKMRKINDYKDSVGLHESYFTKYFADLGYKWDVSADCDDMATKSDYPGFYCGKEMIAERRCPIFKRRAFFHSYGQMLETTAGQPVYELFHYLKDNHLYDTEMIWQNILRTMDHSDIAKNLHLNYTLPTTANLQGEQLWAKNERKIALFVHIYYTDEIYNLKRYMVNMPEGTDVYITTQTEEKKAFLEKACEELPYKVTVQLVKNRGRDVYALLSVGHELVKQYDYICFIHDKKVTQEKPGTVGEGFAYICYENTLGSRAYVENVLNLFETEKHLGVYCPPKPLHGAYVLGLIQEWEKNCENTVELLKTLNVKAPIDKYKLPVAPHGSCFWFKTDAVRPLFDKVWVPEDFPEEPLPVDWTISHAIERVYAYVAQSRGYYTCIGMTDVYSRNEYTTLMHYAGTYANQAFMGVMGGFNGLGNGNKYPRFNKFKRKVKRGLKKVLPKKAFAKTVNAVRKVIGPHEEYKGD